MFTFRLTTIQGETTEPKIRMFSDLETLLLLSKSYNLETFPSE